MRSNLLISVRHCVFQRTGTALAVLQSTRYPTDMYLIWLLLACTSSSPPESNDTHGSAPSTDSATNTSSSSALQTRLEGFPCSEGRDCAEGDPIEEGTCCVLGDALTFERVSEGLEFTRVIQVGEHLLLSERYGLQIRDATTHEVLLERPFVRWKDVALGPMDDAGQKVVFGFPQQYITDSEIWPSQVTVVQLDASGEAELLAERRFPDRSLRGVAWVDNVIYAGCGATGICQFDDEALDWIRLSGPANVEHLVAGLGGLVAVTPQAIMRLEIDEGNFLRVVETATISGQPMDVVVIGDEVWLALGGGGIEVLGPDLKLRRRIDVSPGAYALSVDGERVAVSLWEEVAILDSRSGAVLDRQLADVTDGQVLGLLLRGDRLTVAGWNRLSEWRYSPGLVSPELRLSTLRLSEDQSSAVVSNLGPVSWIQEGSPVSASGTASVWDDSVLHPGSSASWVVPSPLPPGGDTLTLSGNDQDGSLTWELPESSGTRLDVGEALTDVFAPLVPEGNLDGYQGRVTLLAYFALY